MFRKTVLVISAAALVLSFCACGGGGGEASSKKANNPPASAEASSKADSTVSWTPKVYSPPLKVDETLYNVAMCVTEMQSYYSDPAAVTKQRLELYKELGIKTVRAETYWASFEPSQGSFVNPGQQVYFGHLKEAGMRIKMISGTIMGVPSWYFVKYPGSKLLNDQGRRSIASVSYKAPNLREHLDKVLDEMMKYYQRSGLIDNIDSLVVDMGPAGESLYPAAWTQTADGLDNPSGEERFWCYDIYMQADFKAEMEKKYSNIAAANKAWGKAYASFDEVNVPLPKSVTGQMWDDVLTWYRNVKRDFMDGQVVAFKNAVQKYSNGRIKLIIYIPGSEIKDGEWENAVKTGDGSGSVKLMADSRYIIQLAAKHGCWLQYTGAENESEVRYLRKYMTDNKLDNIPMLGENAGGYDVGKSIKSYVNVLVRNGLCGIDMTHSRWVVGSDHAQKNEHYDKLKANLELFSEYMKRGME